MSNKVILEKSIDSVDGFAVVDAGKQELIKIDWLNAQPSDFQKTGDVNDSNITQLNHWLGSIPSVSSAVAGNSRHLMICEVEFDKLMKAKDGTGSLGMVRKSGSTQIGSHPIMNEADKLKTLINTNLLLNLVSNLVAQQHLADINNKLEEIHSGVQKLIEFNNNERISKIQAFYEKLQQVGWLISNGNEVNEITLQTISNGKQEVRGLVLHLKSDFAEQYKKIDQFDSSSLFGSDDLRCKLERMIEELGRLYKEYMLGMQCLVMANLILYLKSGCKEEFAFDGATLAAELESQNGVELNWKKVQRCISFHLGKMKPLFEFKSSTQANAQLVEKSVQKVGSVLKIDSGMLLDLTKRINASKKQKIMLEVESGKVVRGSYLC